MELSELSGFPTWAKNTTTNLTVSTVARLAHLMSTRSKMIQSPLRLLMWRKAWCLAVSLCSSLL